MYNELCTLPKTGITPLTPFWESKAFFVSTHFSHYIIVYFIHDIWVYYIIAKKVLAWSSFVQDSWLLILISSSIVAFNLHISHVRMAPADMLWQIWHVQIDFFLARWKPRQCLWQRYSLVLPSSGKVTGFSECTALGWWSLETSEALITQTWPTSPTSNVTSPLFPARPPKRA